MSQQPRNQDAKQSDAPQVVEVGPLVGGLGMFWLVLTPTLAMYAIRYGWGNAVASLGAFIGIVAVMFLFFRPGSPLFVTSRVLGIGMRVALSAAVAVVLVLAGLPVWAAVYGVFAAAALVLTTRAVKG